MRVWRRSKVSAGLLAAFLVVGFAMSGTASADEFVLGIELGSDVDESEFMAGFQLAVDESPDVSHPPGVEGGDHLGSIDVDVTLDAQGSPIVAVDTSSENFESAGPPDIMRIVFVDRVPSDLPQSTGLFVISREEAAATAVLLSPSFESDFVAAYGEPPTATASRGYAAGKLVDIAVEATDRDPTDIVALRAALDSAIGVEGPATSPTVEEPTAAPEEPPSEEPTAAAAAQEPPPPEEDVPSGGSAINWPALLGVAVVIAAAISGVWFVWWRRLEVRP